MYKLSFSTFNRALAAFMATGLLFSAMFFPMPVMAASTLNRSVAGWLPYWDQTRAFSVVQNNADVFTEMNPYWYDLTNTGQLSALTNAENSTIISYAQNSGKTLLPMISNEYDGNLVSTVINNPSLTQTHITDIVNKVTSLGYSGIEIDYENLLSTDRTAYTSFVQNLAIALHTKGKTLTVVLPAKTSATQYPAFDYVALGQASDELKIMAYDYSWSGSVAGSIAPYTWVNNVLAYAVTAISPTKLMLGVPDYGYDWVGTQGKGVLYSQAVATANSYGAVITEDAQNGPHYSYTLNGISHTVWFEDATSVSSLFDLANKYNVSGVAIWRLGGEDSGIYDAARTKFASAPTSGTASDLTPPTVSLTYSLSKTSITLKAQASDNLGIVKVQFYIDGNLVSTDTLAPYAVTSKIRGKTQNHTLSATAFDAAGNSTTSQQTIMY